MKKGTKISCGIQELRGSTHSSYGTQGIRGMRSGKLDSKGSTKSSYGIQGLRDMIIVIMIKKHRAFMASGVAW